MRALCKPFLLLSFGPLFLQALANPIGKALDSLQEREVVSYSEKPKLDRRWPTLPYPDRDTILNKYFEVPPADASLFFSGLPLGDARFDALKAYAGPNGLRFVNNQYDNKGGLDFCDPANGNDKSDEYRTFSDDFCSIFAKASSGTVFVGIPADCDPSSKSTWVRIEQPALENNNNVKEIVRFDPATPDDKTTIYPAPAPTSMPVAQVDGSADTTASLHRIKKRDSCEEGIPALPPRVADPHPTQGGDPEQTAGF